MTQTTPARKASDGAVLFRTELRPHRSATLKAIHVVVGLLVVLAVPVSVGFMLAGAWPVMGVMGFEFLLLYGALRLNHHRGTVVETIHITRNTVRVQRVNPWGRRQSWAFQPQWLRVAVARGKNRSRLEIGSHGRSVGLGHFLTAEELDELAETLRGALRRLAQPCRPEASPA